MSISERCGRSCLYQENPGICDLCKWDKHEESPQNLLPFFRFGDNVFPFSHIEFITVINNASGIVITTKGGKAVALEVVEQAQRCVNEYANWLESQGAFNVNP